jgi:hypothetical protein
MAQVNQFTGITVTADGSTAVDYVTITNGVHDIATLGAGATSSFLLTSVTVDTSNHVLSGYDSAGVRYIFDKRGAGTPSLDVTMAGTDT